MMVKFHLFVAAAVAGAGFAALAAGGPIVINLSGTADATAAAVVTVDGEPYVPGTVIQDTVFPTQHCVRVSGEGVHVLYWSADKGLSQPPLMSGEHWLMGSTNPTLTATHTAYVTTRAYWVDPTNGVDDVEHGTEAAPFRTPLYAASQAANNSVIYCAAGDYAEGQYYYNSMTNRLHNYSKCLRFVGAGIGKSILHGKLDLESETHRASGRGPAAMRVAAFSGYSVIQNFTVTEGRCASVSNGNLETDRGGAGYGASFADCFFTNCTAFRGQVIYSGSLVRCTIAACGSSDENDGGALLEGSARGYFCSINRSFMFGGGMTCWHCSTSKGDSYYGHYGSGAEAYNCATTPGGTPSDSWNYTMKGCVTKWGSTPSAKLLQQDVLNADSLFVGVSQSDLRLFATSPAIGAGYLPEDYYRFYSAGIEGAPVLFRNGKPTAGAYQKPASGVSVTATSAYAGLDASSGLHAVEPGESLTVSIVDAKRPPFGFVVDGETVAGTSYTFTAPPEGETATGVEISEIVFGTNWYVNAAMPDDSLDGFTPATAKRTLCGAMTNSCVLSGDVVHAAEGVYDEGSILVANDSPTYSRVYVKGGVTLTADGDMYKTLIVGAPAPVERSSTYSGCGEGATRCAHVASTGVLRGFVITNGYTEGNVDGSAGKHGCYGGGIHAVTGARIEDCMITKCVSVRGSAAVGGVFRRCRIYRAGDLADWSGGNCALTEMSNCYLDYCGGAPCPPLFVNNFVGPYNASGGSLDYAIYTKIDATKTIRNCIFCANLRNLGSTGAAMTNCVYKGITNHGADYPMPTNEGFGGQMSCATILANLTTDENGLWTIKKDSAFVDADKATNEWAKAGSTDYCRSQRVYNAAMDVGPWEYDWRGDFSTALGHAGVTVSSASPMVTTNALGKIRLTDGATLALAVSDANARRVAVSVSDGALSATGGVRDQTFTADGAYLFRHTSALAFAFLGDGFADFLAVADRIGTVFTLQ